MSINILILAASRAEFDTHENGYPLCLTTTDDGESLLEKIVKNTQNINDSKYYYAILEDDVIKFHLDRVAELITPGCNIVTVPQNTRGSACTALLASSQMNPDDELLVISANELVEINFNKVVSEFNNKCLDGGSLIFKSIHPRYSYVKVNEDGFVSEAAQRRPISNNATAGVFWFKKTGDFVDSVKQTIKKDSSVDGKYYVAPVFNEMVLQQKKIGVYQLDANMYRPLKDEKQLRDF
jgi:dTDP-glucose pyrophosphorylase